MSLERSAPQPLLSNWEGLPHSAEPLRQAQCGAGVSTAQRTSFLPKVSGKRIKQGHTRSQLVWGSELCFGGHWAGTFNVFLTLYLFPERSPCVFFKLSMVAFFFFPVKACGV